MKKLVRVSFIVVMASAASALSAIFWDTLAPFQTEVTLLPHPEPTPPCDCSVLLPPFVSHYR